MNVLGDKDIQPETFATICNMLDVPLDQDLVDLDIYTPALLNRVFHSLQKNNTRKGYRLSNTERQRLAVAMLRCSPEEYQHLRLLGTTSDHEFDFDFLSSYSLTQLRSLVSSSEQFRRLKKRLLLDLPEVYEEIVNVLVAHGVCSSLSHFRDLTSISESGFRLLKEQLQRKRKQSKSEEEGEEDEENFLHHDANLKL